MCAFTHFRRRATAFWRRVGRERGGTKTIEDAFRERIIVVAFFFFVVHVVVFGRKKMSSQRVAKKSHQSLSSLRRDGRKSLARGKDEEKEKISPAFDFSKNIRGGRGRGRRRRRRRRRRDTRRDPADTADRRSAKSISGRKRRRRGEGRCS